MLNTPICLLVNPTGAAYSVISPERCSISPQASTVVPGFRTRNASSPGLMRVAKAPVTDSLTQIGAIHEDANQLFHCRRQSRRACNGPLDGDRLGLRNGER